MFIWNFAVSTVFSELIDWLYAQTIGFLSNFFAIMGGMGVELFSLNWVQEIIRFFNHLGWALFVTGAIVSCFQCAISAANGKADFSGTAMSLLRGFLSVSLFSLVPVRLYTLSVSLQSVFTAELTGYGTGSVGKAAVESLTKFAEIQTLSELTEATAAGFGGVTNPILLLFCMILMAYAVIKVFFHNLKRGGILLIHIAVGSLYMFGIPCGNFDGFNHWIKQAIALCLTAFLQATILTAGLLIFQDYMLLGLGLMLSAGEIPRIAGAFGLDTGTQVSLSGAVHTAQSAVSVTQTIVKAVR